VAITVYVPCNTAVPSRAAVQLERFFSNGKDWEAKKASQSNETFEFLFYFRVTIHILFF
jgi:hypothetical protein